MKVFFLFFFIFGVALSCNNFQKYLTLFCKYGSESQPCTIENHSAFKSACCSLPGGCSFSEFPKDQVCCFTQSCLNRCYPGKRYQIGTVY